MSAVSAVRIVVNSSNPKMKIDTKVIHIGQSSGMTNVLFVGTRAGHFWENPIKVGVECLVCGKKHILERETILCFRQYMYDRMSKDRVYKSQIRDLYGKTLACCCKPSPCHADMLAEATQRIYDLEHKGAEKRMYAPLASRKAPRMLSSVAGKIEPIAALQKKKPIKVEIVSKKTGGTTTSSTGYSAKGNSTTPVSPRVPQVVEGSKKVIQDNREMPIAEVGMGDPLVFVKKYPNSEYSKERIALFASYGRDICMIGEVHSDVLVFGQFCNRSGEELTSNRVKLSQSQVKHLLPYFLHFAKTGKLAPEAGPDVKKIESET